ncbi:T9SS type A sorting domain-containing protein [Flavobacterium alkalisoli]|uniref:T9SS type A sorting domain-containing protein n=1 Tax=Flavobacterium alkalisoli TaxID=2602769 RepID=A0A5B9FW11_9FLAO|nr:T9SS type A sorting domain-containing protein [Flavobacterium alkalisoli]QEE48847.1 T9SS type A sorting domain-containing protein [Flavobacterium alkalisoli]
MKTKILTLFLAISLGCFAQTDVEGFEGDFPPPGWTINQSNSGWIKTWQQSFYDFFLFPPYEGDYAAFMDRENVYDPDGPAVDWLITPLKTVSGDSPVVHFYSRLTLQGDQGNVYRLMISTDSDPFNIDAYATLKQWSEFEINPVQAEYNEIYVPVPLEFVGQQVYYAFVMSTDNGDRWLIDNVSFEEDYCGLPTNLNAVTTTPNSATLSWTGGNESLWEVELLGSDEVPANEGVLVNQNSYTVDGLAAGNYKFYVRAVCSETNIGLWSGPYNFELYNGIEGVVSFDSDKDKECDSGLEGAEVILTINDGEQQYTTYTDNTGYYSFYPLFYNSANVSISVIAPQNFKEIDPVTMFVDFNEQPDVNIDMCFNKVRPIPCFVDLTKSINQGNAVQLSLYPNPVTDMLYFNIQNNEQLKAVEVYDVNGKLCFKQDNLQGSIDVQSLRSGFYFIRLTTETMTINKRFIKK